LLGLPGYTWQHPTGFMRTDLALGAGGLPGTTAADVRRELLDAHGVDVALLTADDGISVSLMASPYRAAELARAHNDWMAARWLDEDARFRGTILVPAQDPLAAAEEIHRVAADPRFAAVLLCGGSERPYGEPRYLPIFAAATEHDLPVAIHSGAEGLGLSTTSGGAGLPAFYLEWHTLGSACSIMAHLVSLVCHGTFERLPQLRVLLMEGGIAWLPGILWRLDTNWRGLKAEAPWLERRPTEVVREHIAFTTQPLEHTDGRDELLFEMLEAAGAPDILCFASDYPHWDFDDPARMLARLPEAWRETVMTATAERVFGARLAAGAV
jgi:predicted TIM-barrel fold metal-dependent hydrolase